MPDELFFRESLVNKMNYGILHQLPATSDHINSKQQTSTLSKVLCPLNQLGSAGRDIRGKRHIKPNTNSVTLKAYSKLKSFEIANWI